MGPAEDGGRGLRGRGADLAQLVFVHGVNTRRELDVEAYDKAVGARSRRFEQTCFHPAEVQVRNPYWGTYGANPAWNFASVPKLGAPAVALGIDDDLAERRLIEAAAHDLPAIVGALSVVDLQAKIDDPEALAEAEQLWSGAAAYAEAVAAPGWLKDVRDDAEFLDRLAAEARAMLPRAATISLGFGDSMRDAGRLILGGVNDLTSGPLVALVRRVATPLIARFIGDVFHYLTETDARAQIQAAILVDIMAAARDAATAKSPLVLVGHSMGGVILYDMLSDPKVLDELGTELGRAFHVDLLVTVGSQVSFFEELKSFRTSEPNVRAPDKVARPAHIGAWWNIWDRMDPLAFVAADVFGGVEDLQANTIAHVFAAHTAYFSNMVFYERLAKRLKRAGLAT